MTYTVLCYNSSQRPAAGLVVVVQERRVRPAAAAQDRGAAQGLELIIADAS